MISVKKSSKMIFLKYWKQIFINKTGNWEWIIFIKIIGITSYQLLLFIILKDKRWKNDQYLNNRKKDAYILLSENSWTNIKLYMK